MAMDSNDNEGAQRPQTKTLQDVAYKEEGACAEVAVGASMDNLAST